MHEWINEWMNEWPIECMLVQLAHRSRRRPYIDPTLAQRLLFVGMRELDDTVTHKMRNLAVDHATRSLRFESCVGLWPKEWGVAYHSLRRGEEEAMTSDHYMWPVTFSICNKLDIW